MKKICLFIVAMVVCLNYTKGAENLVGLATAPNTIHHGLESAWTPTAEWPVALEEWSLNTNEWPMVALRPTEERNTVALRPTEERSAVALRHGEEQTATNVLKPMTFWQRRDVQVGFGLMGIGAIAASADLQTRQLREDYLPHFRYHYDDYLQFSPLVATVALKAFGVESRSDWTRLTASAGAGVGVTLAVVYAGKFGVGRLRPDNTQHNSFPSGHTAMAFSSATILHKEYGHLSPWVSVAGYTAATITGISRMLNNRHWLTDVLVGAGVGIVGTELGYLICDRLFGSRGLVRPQDDTWSPVHIGRKPSYIGISLLHNALPYDEGRYRRVAPSGIGFSMEGAWFFTPRIGVGGMAKVGRYGDIVERDILGTGYVSHPKPLNSLAVEGGLFYNHPLSERWSLGAKALAGVAKNHRQTGEVYDSKGTLLGTIEHDATEHFTATFGMQVRYVTADNLGVRLFADYNYLRTTTTFTPALPSREATTTAAYRHPLSAGIAVDVMLW